MNSRILEALRGFPSLHSLIEPLDQLLRSEGDAAFDWFGIPAGTILFREGDSAPDAFILLSGRLGVFLGDDSSAPPIAAVSAGEFVGEMGLISDEPRSATVIALRDSDLLRLPKGAIQTLMRSHHGVAMCVIQLLTRRLRRTSRTRELTRGIRNMAVLPLSRQPIDTRFVEEFVASLRRSAIQVDIVTGEAARRQAELPQDGEDDAQRISLYIADGMHSAWARRCIRQADHVIFLANAKETLKYDCGEAISYAAQLHRTSDLVLLNESDSAAPSGATDWLTSFSSEHILHIRAGSRDDYDRIARLSCRRGIGLVFSGGGARAFAHIGVVKAFVSAGIPIDLVGGTSMGSLVASLVAAELSPDAIADKLRDAFLAQNPLNDYIFPLLSLARGRKLTRLLKYHCGEAVIEDLWKTFFCVSANLSTGSTMVHKRGPLWRALRASVGIPGIYPPWVENGEILVDGGIMLNFPTTTMAALQRGPVVGVEVSPETTFMATATDIEEKSLLWLFLKGRREVPSIVRLLMRSSIVNGEAQSAAGRAAADVLIRPDVGEIRMLSFKAFDTAIEAGYRAAMESIPQIQQLMADTRLGVNEYQRHP